MPEYDFTSGTVMLLVGTIFLMIGFVISVIFETLGIFAIIFIGSALLSLGATYAAATYMSITSAFQKARFVYDKPREGSAGFVLGLAATVFGLIPLILVLLSEGWDANVILAASIGGFGGIVGLLGAIKVNLEWNE